MLKLVQACIHENNTTKALGNEINNCIRNARVITLTNSMVSKLF
jgi:hypothetical protein